MSNGIEKILKLEEGRVKNAIRIKHHYLQQLFWECTLRCNLRCLHCGSSCTATDNRADMPLEDFIVVLDEVKQVMHHPILVITTGGEPLMRRDILTCGQEISKRGFYWGIVTNGTYLTKTMLDGLLDSGLNSISVSIDGLIDEHNWVRGCSNSFDSVTRAIDVLSNNKRNLTWDVITCVNKHNISNLNDLYQFLIEHRVKRWKIFSVFPMGRAEGNSDMNLDQGEFLRLMDFISHLRKDNVLKVSYGCEGFLGLFEYEVRDEQYFCSAGVNVASIRYDGAISGCLSIRHDYNEGNIYQDSFVDVWNNRFQRYRQSQWKKKGICQTCEVWRWCQGNGMHLRDDEGNLLLCNYRKLYHNDGINRGN